MGQRRNYKEMRKNFVINEIEDMPSLWATTKTMLRGTL